MANLVSRLTATIGNGASLSDALTISGGKVSFIEMPATWTTAVITFKGSMDNSNFYSIYDDDGNEVIAFVEASRRIHLSATNLNQHKYLKLQSGTTANVVLQGGARTIYVEVWS